MPLPVWIVVANGTRARLLQRKAHAEALTEVRDWVHPATREHQQDLGNGHRQSGIRGRSGLAERSPAHDRERSAFAREICQWLSHGLSIHQAGSVALLSSNPFLGDLVAQGQNGLHKHLCGTHAVDLTALPLHELDERLRREFRL